MKAYAIAQLTVEDQAMYHRYRSGVVATLEPFGGKFVVRGSHLTVVDAPG